MRKLIAIIRHVLTISCFVSFSISTNAALIEAGIPTYLAHDASQYGALTLGRDDVFWVDPRQRQILKVPKTGGPVTKLASLAGPSWSAGRTIDSFGTDVYWAEHDWNTGFGAIKMVPAGGGVTSTVASGNWGAFGGITGLAVDSSGIYWSVAGKNIAFATNTGTVMGLVGVAVDNPTLLSQSSPITLAAGLVSPRGLALDNTDVYWIEAEVFKNTNQPGGVGKVAKTGGQFSRIASGLGELEGIAIDNNNVFFGTWNGPVSSVPKSGGSVVTLGGYTSSHSLAVDDNAIYYTNYMGNSISKMSKDGSGNTVLASGLTSPWGLAVDDSGLYWTECPTCLPAQGKVGKISSSITLPPTPPLPVANHGLFVGVWDGPIAGGSPDFRGDLAAINLAAAFNKLPGFQGKALTADLTSGNGISNLQLKTEIENIYAHMKPGDNLFLYLAAHGFGRGDEAIRLGKGFAGELSDDELTLILEPLSGVNKWIIMDACYSGGFWGPGDLAETLDYAGVGLNFDTGDLNRVSQIALLTSASEQTQAYYSDVGLPLIYYALSDGLTLDANGFYWADLNQDQILDMMDLGRYVQLYANCSPQVAPTMCKNYIGQVVFEMDFGDPAQFSSTLLSPMFFVSNDFSGAVGLSVIPEPSTAALLLIAMLGIRKHWSNPGLVRFVWKPGMGRRPKAATMSWSDEVRTKPVA